MNFPWTDERCDLLRKLHAEGLSFSQIGGQLGCSRNAAIGKAQRIGLEKRGPAFRSNKSISAKPRGRRVRIRIVGNAVKQPRPELDLPDELAPEIVCDPVTLLNLQSHHCRWPVSGEGASMLFCGANKSDGSSYCAHHRARSCGKQPRFDRAEHEVRQRLRSRMLRAA
jgi:GcrA cell cycle regulator